MSSALKESLSPLYLDFIMIGVAVLGLSIIAYLVLKNPKDKVVPAEYNSLEKFKEMVEKTPLDELLKMPERTDPKLPIFTLEELSKYHGKTKKRLVGAKGLVFDVSSNEVYKAPGGGYSMFCGNDASVALANMNHDDEYFNVKKHDWRKLDKEKLTTLNQWVDFFEKRYPIVGYLYDPKIDGAKRKNL